MLDQLLILTNNSIVDKVKKKEDFATINEAIKNLSIVMKSQIELEKLQLEKAKVSDPNAGVKEYEEDGFFNDFKTAEVIDEIA